MKVANLSRAHWLVIPPRDGEDEGSTGNEGNEGSTGLTLEELRATPEGQAAIQALLDEEVAGLKAKNTELLGEKDALKTNLSKYDNVDLEKITALQKQIDENEEMKLLSEGKTEEVVERRVEAMRKDFEATNQSLLTKLDEAGVQLVAKQEELTKLVVDGDIRQNYMKLDFEPTAMDDIITLGRSTFVMDDTGKAIPRDVHGNIIFSKDGKTPIEASEWLEGLAEKKKYLRRASSGAGASGGRGGRGDVDTSKMTNTQRIAHGLANGLLD